MKQHSFRHLFPKKKNTEDHLPDTNVKKVIFVFFVIFFFLYIQYKPYSSTSHQIRGIAEYVFYIYQFMINQTLGIVHEGGHGVCYILPCPQFIMVIMGTLFQWGFPLGIAYYYKIRDNRMAFYMGLFIFGISMDYTSWYMSTAHEGLHLPASKSFLGVDALHDFNYIFSTLGLMPYESLISGMTKVLSVLVMFGSLTVMFFEAFSDKKEEK